MDLISLTYILTLVNFAFVTAYTPGPNNIMLAASGATFGLGRTLPHIFGIFVGLASLMFSVGFGLGEIFVLWPIATDILLYGGSAYLVFLAIKLFRFAPKSGAPETQRTKPFSLWQAALFQWVNPKAWVMATIAFSAFRIDGMMPLANLVLVVGVVISVGLTSAFFWSAVGLLAQAWLGQGRRLLYFNRALAISLLLTVLLILWEGQKLGSAGAG